MSNQPVFNSKLSSQQTMDMGGANQQAISSSTRGKQVPVSQLLPAILSLLERDKGSSMQLQTLYQSFQSNEITKGAFVQHMRTIVGDQKIKMALYKFKRQDPRDAATQQHMQAPSNESSDFTLDNNALGCSPSPPSKKQKLSGGAFIDQSIEQLNDVIAVSGVNLREEELLFFRPKEVGQVSEASGRVVQEEEDRLILQKIPLQKKLAQIMAKSGLKSIGSNVEKCLSLCFEKRMRGLISSLIRLSKQRVGIEKPRHRTFITTDVRKKIMVINNKAKVEWEKKETEEEQLERLNKQEGSTALDSDKEKDESRARPVKVVANKEEGERMRTTAANLAARAAVGGEDMLSKWKLMAEQARQILEGGTDGSSGSRAGKDVSRKTKTAEKSERDHRESEKRGSIRKLGRNQVIMAHNRVARAICVKDVIGVLEREGQMPRSTLIYRLYDEIRSGSSAHSAD